MNLSTLKLLVGNELDKVPSPAHDKVIVLGGRGANKSDVERALRSIKHQHFTYHTEGVKYFIEDELADIPVKPIHVKAIAFRPLTNYFLGELS